MNLYARSFSVLKRYWLQLGIASLSAAFHAVFSGLLIWMFGPLLMTVFQIGEDSAGEQSDRNDSVLQAASGFSDRMFELRETMKEWINQVALGDTPQETLVRFCVIILVVVIAKNLFLYIQGYNMAYVQQSVMKHFRDQLFAKYQRLSLDFFHRRKTGQVISLVTNDVMVLNEAIDVGFNRLVTDTLLVGILASFLIILSWKLTLLSMIILPAVFGFIWFIGKKLRKYSARSQERMAEVNSVLEESVNNIRIVKAFSMEQFETKKFMKTTSDYLHSLLRMTRIRHLASPVNDTLATVAAVVILLYAGSRIIAGTGEFSAGDFMTFLLAMITLIRPVKSLSQIHIKLQEGMAASERIFGVLDSKEKVVDPVHPVPLYEFKDILRYEQVSFQYVSKEPVLVNISFDVKPGEVVAIVGPSGAGKSTLLDLLPRFYDPLAGRVTIDGHDIRDYSLDSLRSLMGIVTQETYLFNDSIRNNIAYGLEELPLDSVIKASQMSNADEFIQKFSNGYETIVGNRGVRLSGGQRQRISIARALLKNPQILIFDEATSALDSEAELLVQEAIERLMSGRTVLVIAHRLSTIKNADRILVLDEGRIVEFGSHEQLLEQNGLYHRLYKLQFRGVAS